MEKLAFQKISSHNLIYIFLLMLPNYVKGQIEESVSYVDSLTTNRYTCITTFYSTDKGFTYTESKVYRVNNLIEYETVIGTIADIDTDSISYGKSGNHKTWIKFQTVKGETFDYSYSLKNKNQFVKYKQDSIKTYIIKLPKNKAKAFLKALW